MIQSRGRGGREGSARRGTTRREGREGGGGSGGEAAARPSATVIPGSPPSLPPSPTHSHHIRGRTDGRTDGTERVRERRRAGQGKGEGSVDRSRCVGGVADSVNQSNCRKQKCLLSSLERISRFLLNRSDISRELPQTLSTPSLTAPDRKIQLIGDRWPAEEIAAAAAIQEKRH